jgi:CheY-like chemotaxis protein
VDVGLPGFDGYEVARRIRATADNERLCLIAVTGYGLAADQEQARQAGFNFHLVKPVHPSQINTLLRNLGTGLADVIAAGGSILPPAASPLKPLKPSSSSPWGSRNSFRLRRRMTALLALVLVSHDTTSSGVLLTHRHRSRLRRSTQIKARRMPTIWPAVQRAAWALADASLRSRAAQSVLARKRLDVLRPLARRVVQEKGVLPHVHHQRWERTPRRCRSREG